MTEEANPNVVGFTHVMDLGFRCEYLPQPDITAYELAQLIPFFHGAVMTETAWTVLGGATRHLKRAGKA